MIPVNNQGFVKDLLEEACKFLQTVQTDKMRLVEITQNKIQGTVPANTNIDELDLFNKSYRIEVFYFLCILYDSNFQKQLFGDCLGNGAKQSIIVKRLTGFCLIGILVVNGLNRDSNPGKMRHTWPHFFINLSVAIS